MASYGLSELLAEIEGDLEWRQSEVTLLKRAIADTNNAALAKSLRRALITLLYAHVEGGIRLALSTYIRVINGRGLKTGECNPHVAASAWDAIFRALSDPSSKNPHFRARLPDDAKLHRFTRRAEFVARSRHFEALAVRLSDEEIVDTEGNVDQNVLSKILFRLGFSPDVVDKRFSDLQYLRALRNPIAHGEDRVATEEQCKKYEKAVFGVLTRLRDLLEESVRQNAFLRRGDAA
jgi:hypothetical protein